MSEVHDRVALPGLLLALTGVLSLLTGGLGLLAQMASLVPAFLASLDTDVASFLITASMSTLPVVLWLCAGLAAAGLTVLAGLRLRALRSPTVVYAGAVAAMLPCCNACCAVGVLTGGWTLWVMQDDSVRAAMADA
ncbi:MAG: hypothetical protein KC656_09560 [Myxococcales bacterium]|nr:hypothetical protein [Myxococcales bacterium]